MVERNLLESLNLFTLQVSLSGDKVRQSGWLSCACSAPSDAPRRRAGVVSFMSRAPRSLGAPHTAVCRGPALSHVTLFSRVKQEDLANVGTSKGPLSSLYTRSPGLD